MADQENAAKKIRRRRGNTRQLDDAPGALLDLEIRFDSTDGPPLVGTVGFAVMVLLGILFIALGAKP